MQKEFYTSVQVQGSNILYRGYKDGKRVQGKERYAPALYTKTKETSEYSTLFEEFLHQHTFGSIAEAKNFIKEMKDVSNAPIYGNNAWEYSYIAEHFRGEVDYDFTSLNIISLDIETKAENGFPKPSQAREEILLISLMDFRTKQIITLGSQEVNHPDVKNYVKCNDEVHLLKTFIKLLKAKDPDIITGWNVVMFDIAYLAKRIEVLLGPDAVSELSPWGKVESREVKMKGRTEIAYSIEGIAVLDLLDLYKKFMYVRREKYTLDHIAEVELKENKLVNPYKTFREFYEKDFPLFVKYNQRDVVLVDRLEEKLGLLYLAVSVAYIAKINYEDVFSPVKTWDCFIKAELLSRNIFVEVKSIGFKEDEQIEGAYVMEPFPGFYEWVASFDATSLYPMILVMLNMSPETIVGQVTEMTPDRFLELVSQPGKMEEITQTLKQHNYTMAANGVAFKRDKMGIMPELTKRVFEGRKTAKKKMLAAKQQYIDTDDISFKKEADRQGVVQLALKVLLNSLYGAMANKWFTFYDPRIAEGITLTGQFIIKIVRERANTNIEKITGVKKDYGFYCDTDSVYLTLDAIVQKYCKDQPIAKTVTFLDQVCEKKISKFFDEGTDIVHSVTNAFENTISFKREAIADKGFWVAKKKYALRVWNNEGVQYDEPDIKVMGIEVVRSSTPAVIRDWLKESIVYILDGKINELRQYIDQRHQEFTKLDYDKVAFPRGANNLEEYSSSATIYAKGCPMQVRGSLLYNHYLTTMELDKIYKPIQEGDKIKYLHLKLPNRVKENVIAYLDELPEEFGINDRIDYETQWEKGFIAPLNNIMEAVKWELEEKSTLDDFFS
ncbi:DNA polymerase [Synechococcus phage BUCT-ZZ01]|nr:DNA polymerase [Synechococcus phage BUCT-ZZ01]